MENYEKLGAFYLGREHDLERRKDGEALLLYDSKDLCTHAVCVGMTGSGKTGLCIGLLEEAAIDGIPAIVIDPKGDLGNLLLTFPELRREDFKPWVNVDDARRGELSIDEYAAKQAEAWKTGLESWGQSGERIKRLKESAEFSIYTPGSDAGIPVSILSSFAAPPRALLSDGDLLQDRISTTVTSLLGLMGIAADPIRSREHILLSTLFDHHWREGKPLELGALIQAIQNPPIDRVGVLELEAFYPSKDRFDLAIRLNNLLAAPGFQSWMQGEPLDIDRMLHTATGRPRVAIFSIAHLSEPERMFFVSLLLNQTLGWMRSRPGTTSLRALLYMDEIFGYMPPIGEPPSKKPLLTLLKQARAYGLGIVLATQNPVDLDYKGLSNIGTWFLGRLQTERDKLRVLEGLEGAASGGTFDRQRMEQTLAGLGNRVFLMHNVHEDRPVVFSTRWVLSYLCGPLTRDQIKRLMQDRRPQTVDSPAPIDGAVAGEPAPAPSAATVTPPVLSPSIRQVYLPVRGTAPDALVYRPALLGLARVQFIDRKSKKVQQADDVALLLPLERDALTFDWEQAGAGDLVADDLLREPAAALAFGELPPDAGDPKNYPRWERELLDFLYRERSLDIFTSTALSLSSLPGESERDFRIRLSEIAREKRDGLAGDLRKKYATKLDRLQEQIRKAEEKTSREQQQASGQKLRTAINVGTTLLSAFLGRKALSLGTLGRASTAATSASRSAKENADVGRAQESVQALQQQMEALNRELEDEVQALSERFDAEVAELETVSIRPRRSDVDLRLVALAWLPYRRDANGVLSALWE